MTIVKCRIKEFYPVNQASLKDSDNEYQITFSAFRIPTSEFQNLSSAI